MTEAEHLTGLCDCCGVSEHSTI